MYNVGDKFRLHLPIIGKKNQFDEGLIGEITEIFNRDNGRAYRVQFNDGRAALLPENIILESSTRL
ncbi:MAG: hypothetical protein GWO07_11845 [Candidatus Dadabacteria bacterium]|nr:hypothetical protein [Candidatus Dadabacteria bacterium]NIV41776.1 hypothetical protein [Candidatus Dadabacteria bacterium]NIX14663.1 hypothetical protein [Candidatus Dadabacteria bacterium]